MRWLCVNLLLRATTARSEPWRIAVPETAFDYSSPGTVQLYTPLAYAARPWTFCVAYPHLTDSYGLSVNHGMVEEARRPGVGFRLVEAGGCPHFDRQRQQVRDCVAEGADARIIGTVSFDEMSETRDPASFIPVINLDPAPD